MTMRSVAQLLGIDFPLLQAGMGGVAGPELAAAVSAAGAGGIVGLYRMKAHQVIASVQRTAQLTSRPFGVNLIPELLDKAALASQVNAVLAASDARVFFTFFGNPDPVTSSKILGAGRAMVSMVGSVEGYVRAESLGASAIVVQGSGAGGHLLGTQSLAEIVHDLMKKERRTPFLCAGGIADGRVFHALHQLGASGCLCGTLFVATDESRAHHIYKQRLVQAEATDTLITDQFEIGWPKRAHRVLRNRLTDRHGLDCRRVFIAKAMFDNRTYPIPRFSSMVPTAATEGDIEEMVMYAGTSVSSVRDVISARERVELFKAQFVQAERLSNVQRTVREVGVSVRAGS